MPSLPMCTRATAPVHHPRHPHRLPTAAAGYRNKSIKSLIANVEAGKHYPDTGDAADTQANMLCKVGSASLGSGCTFLPALALR